MRAWVIIPTLLLFASIVGCSREPVVCYGMHNNEVTRSEVPPAIMDTFTKTYPTNQIIRIQRTTAGGRFLFYAFKFSEGERTREVLISKPKKIEMVYDVDSNAAGK
jgi:hypothetical protein